MASGRWSESGGCVGLTLRRRASLVLFLFLSLGLWFCLPGSHWAGPGCGESAEGGRLGLSCDPAAWYGSRPWDRGPAKKSGKRSDHCDNNWPLVRRNGKSRTTRMVTGNCHECVENVAVGALVEIGDPPPHGPARGSICPADRSTYLACRHLRPENVPFSPPPCGSLDRHIGRGGHRRYSEKRPWYCAPRRGGNKYWKIGTKWWDARTIQQGETRELGKGGGTRIKPGATTHFTRRETPKSWSPQNAS
jgi:hypothetical protein